MKKNVIGSSITLVIATLLIFMSTGVAMATVTTDQADYSPGSTVTISGDNSDGIGYLAGETVIVSVNGPYQYDSKCSGIADANGTWSCRITLSSDYTAEGSYTYTVVGQTSGVTQSGTFTDAPISTTLSKPSISATSISLGNSINIAGTLAVGSGTLNGHTIRLQVSFNGGAFTNPAITMTDSSGRYSFSYTPASAGSYVFRTRLVTGDTGNSGYKEANSDSSDTLTVVTDTTPPIITPTVTGTFGTNGWYISNVGVSWTVTDAESAITFQSGCGATTISSDTTGTTFTCTATSGGGTNSQSVAIKRDATPPTVTASPTRTSPDYNGWYNKPVTIFLTGSDTGSGMDTCDPSVNYNTDSAAASISGNCKDNAGNIGTGTFSFKYDGTPPTATLAVTSGTPGTNGWYTSDVTVSTSGTDSVSSPVACTADQYLTGDTIGAIFNGKCTNGAGLSTDASSLTVKLDETGPTAALSITKGTLGDNGWYVSDVIVHTDGSDTVSSPVTCTTDQSFTSDMQDTAIKGACRNDAGLSTDAYPLNIKIDKTPPTVVATSDRSADHNGWYNKAITVAFSGTDSISGIVSCDPSASYSSPDSATASVSGACKDNAGNVGTGKLEFKYDGTSPVINVDASTSDGIYTTNTWTNKDVTVHFTATDPVSGIDTVAPDTKISAEGADQSVAGSATDIAGNTASTSFTGINIDKTPPTITGSRSPLANANGWNNADVTVHFDCSDSLSGIDSCTSDNTLSSEAAGQSASGTAKDKAGNVATTTVGDINIDKTAPIVTSSKSPGPNTNGWNNAPVKVTIDATDSLSGIDGSATQSSTLSSEGANQKVGYTFIDKAGNTVTGSVTGINIDLTPPTISGVPTTSANANGWYNTDVVVHFIASDYLSGIDSTTLTPDQTLSNEGKGQSATGSVTDKAGNTASTIVSGINIDKTAPIVTLNPSADSCSLPGNAGWCRGVQTAGFDAKDDLSGLADANKASFTRNTADNGAIINIVSGQVCDAAGNCNPGISAGPYKIDSVAPIVSASSDRTADHNGWYNSPVKISFSGIDSLSGIASCDKVDYNGPDTATVSVSGTCKDNAGNIGTGTLNFKYDSTPPTAILTASGTQGLNGWYISNVVVSSTGTDSVSTPVSCTGDQSFTTETTGITVTGSCTNDAGLSTNAAPLTIKIDLDPPTITITTPTNGASYILNQVVVANYNCVDTISGVASCVGTVANGANIDTSSVGTKTFTVKSTDNAGDQGQQQYQYNDIYAFGGILQPINKDGSSIFKLGSTVPVKFQLTDYNGNYISTAVATINVAKIDNNVEGTYVEAVSTSAATTGNLFRYDSTSNQYIFNLATKPLSTGTWNIKISINDGTTYTVKISLK